MSCVIKVDIKLVDLHEIVWTFHTKMLLTCGGFILFRFPLLLIRRLTDGPGDTMS